MSPISNEMDSTMYRHCLEELDSSLPFYTDRMRTLHTQTINYHGPPIQSTTTDPPYNQLPWTPHTINYHGPPIQSTTTDPPYNQLPWIPSPIQSTTTDPPYNQLPRTPHTINYHGSPPPIQSTTTDPLNVDTLGSDIMSGFQLGF